MKTKHTGKLFAFLLALVMMFGMLPLTAHAVTIISTVTASVAQPIAGDTPAAHAISGGPYAVRITKWFEGDDLNDAVAMDATETFRSGETYWVQVTFTPHDGYEFSSNTTAQISGKDTTVHGYVPSTGAHYFITWFTLPADPVIPSASATVTKPVPGAHPDFKPISGDGNKYDVSFEWWHVEEDSREMTSTDVFEMGKTYSVRIWFEPKNGYIFNNSTEFTINGEKAVSSGGSGYSRLRSVEYSLASETLLSLTATVTAPAEGARPDLNVVSGDSSKYEAHLAYWSFIGSDYGLDDNYVFEPEFQYTVRAYFQAKTGYSISDSAKITINGENNLSVYKHEWAGQDTKYYVKRNFTVPAHTHAPSTAWKTDTAYHWHTCSGCSELVDKAAHSYGVWTVTKAATETATGSRERTCAVCGYKQTEVIQKLSHTHNYTGAWKSDATNHWQLCSCGEKGNTAAHSYGAWTVTKAATETAEGSRERTCAVCGYKQTEVIPMLSHTHAYGTEWKNDDSQHWHECDCGDKSDTAAHTFSEWTVTKEATEAEEGLKNRTCSACGYVESLVIPVLGHEHSYTEEWKSDAANHWNECDCGEKSNAAAHTFGEWETVKEATATEEGVRKRACTVCGYEEYEAIPVNGTESTAPSEPDTSEPDTSEPDTSEPIPNDPEKPEGSFPWWIIVVAVVAVGGIATVVIVIIKKKKQV